MTREPHKGFIINAKPFPLKGDRWPTKAVIERHTGDGVHIKPFIASNMFPTEQEAVA